MDRNDRQAWPGTNVLLWLIAIIGVVMLAAAVAWALHAPSIAGR